MAGGGAMPSHYGSFVGIITHDVGNTAMSMDDTLAGPDGLQGAISQDSALTVAGPPSAVDIKHCTASATVAATEVLETPASAPRVSSGTSGTSGTDNANDVKAAKRHLPTAMEPREPVPRRSLLSRLRIPWPLPSYVWIALGVLVVVEVLAVVGAISYANAVHSDARSAAADLAHSAARAIEVHLDHLMAPVLALANLAYVEPHWPTLMKTFHAYADAIYLSNPYYQIELCPAGVVASMSMPAYTANMTVAERQDFFVGFDFGVDILDPERFDVDVEYASILQNGSVPLLGPWYADGELSSGAFVMRYSIFLPPGDWELPPNHVHLCPKSICTRADGAVWWGWSNAVFAWKSVSPGLLPLQERGMLYTLAPDPRAANQSFLAASDPLPDPSECEEVRINVYGWMQWTFCVEPEGGFGPVWRSGLIVGVSALAVLLAVLVGLVLRSRGQAVQHLAQQLELNRQLAVAKEQAVAGRRVLEEEKRVMDVLMQRQRNLIELFGKEDELLAGVDEAENETAKARRRLQLGGVSHGSMSSLSRESSTIDRIEAVRRQLSMKSSAKKSAAADDIKLLEMLGEGSFGKVYKGLWRGTEVAVKTMVLPANMSGAEKREKMAVMEAAISSAMNHPCIVQTYTYFIKTVREEAAEEDVITSTEGILVGNGGGSTTAGTAISGSGASRLFDDPAAPPASSSVNAHAVHGYEVRLVLEYCDKGCLREALDGDAFLTPTGVNYRGVLDSAADVAKAMLHLHLNDVLHGDLKARNVMMKNIGGEGRGVICKVADFGLAVKMDTTEQTHMSGMFQGTLTHMAPELMLHGRMSKAADVYAFGITLWEMFVGGNAFQGLPRALLGHQVANERKRPPFPPFTPEAYLRLASDCWAHEAEQRPTFEIILERLTALRAELPGPAAALGVYNIGTSAPATPTHGAPAAGMAFGSGAGQGQLPKLGEGAGNATGADMGAGSGITVHNNWSFMRAARGPQLAVVEEDDREGQSSKLLPVLPGAQQQQQQQQGQLRAAMPTVQEQESAADDGDVRGRARAEAELEAGDSSSQLPPLVLERMDYDYGGGI